MTRIAIIAGLLGAVLALSACVIAPYPNYVDHADFVDGYGYGYGYRPYHPHYHYHY